MVEVDVERTIDCAPETFLVFAMDPERYQEVDDKIVRVLWQRREGNLTEFKFKPRLPGMSLPEPNAVSQMTLTPGKRIDVRLAPPPRNRVNHFMATFGASWSCVPDGGRTRVRRRISFDSTRWCAGFSNRCCGAHWPAPRNASCGWRNRSWSVRVPHSRSLRSESSNTVDVDWSPIRGKPMTNSKTVRKSNVEEHVEVVVVGAGLSGIAAAVKLRRGGIDDFVVLEKAGRVGGTTPVPAARSTSRRRCTRSRST